MNKDIILKYNQPGPRYTSYPPATFFDNSFTREQYRNAIVRSNEKQPENISIYIHVPFCPKICHFCGCNTDILGKKELIEQYFDALVKEIDAVGLLLNKDRKITQVHWGGGTPNAVSVRFIEKVMTRLYLHFNFAPEAEIAMECNPAYLTKDYVRSLAELGFNRISLGIQDTRKDVLDAVNRSDSKMPLDELMHCIRANSFKGINIDLIYGLPLQTTESFAETVKQVAALQPDRLVTFSYAHVPWVKSAQKILKEYGLPEANEKLDMFSAAYDFLGQNGYESIGMDHYAKPDDELSKARKEHTLHRNFQGYCTRETTGQVYAFGSTGISQLNDVYAQNIKGTSEYIQQINQFGLAIERGYALTQENLIVRRVINEIMCNCYLDFNSVAKEFEISSDQLKKITGFKEEKLTSFVEDNLLTFKNNIITISEAGMLVVRNIAMVFDPLINVGKNQYSKTI